MKRFESPTNAVIKQLAKLRKSNSKEKVIVSGKKLLMDLTKKLTPNLLILDKSLEESEIPNQLKNLKCTIQYAPQKFLKKISNVQHSDGYVGEFIVTKSERTQKIKKMILIDKIQEPGNLGTIFRTAHCFNFDFVYMMDTTVNYLNEKCVRASQGASMLMDTGFFDINF
jgi:RNA methyltransferase, TrmH family